MYKNKKIKLETLSDAEKISVMASIKKTVISYMNDGFSYGLSCAAASRQSNIQKGDVLRELAKDRDLIDLRDDFIKTRRFNKRQFILGVQASKEALQMFEALENEK